MFIKVLPEFQKLLRTRKVVSLAEKTARQAGIVKHRAVCTL